MLHLGCSGDKEHAEVSDRRQGCRVEGVGAQRVAAARREGASAAELDAAVGLVALDALRIAMRSRHNRVALEELGALRGLVGLMKARLLWFEEPCCADTKGGSMLHNL